MKTLYIKINNLKYKALALTFIVSLMGVITAFGQKENLYFTQAMKQYRQCNYSAASSAFTEALVIDPESGEAYMYRGMCSIFLGDFKTAKNDLDVASKKIKTTPELLLAYGYLYNETKDYKKAITYLNDAIKLDGKFAKAYNARGYSYQSLGDYRLALQDYGNAINADPTFALAYNNRGSAIYYNQDIAMASKMDLKNALEDFTNAVKFDTGFCLAKRNKALAHNMLNQPREALAEIDNAISCDPENVDNYVTKGTILFNLNKNHDAIAAYQLAIEKKPDFGEAYLERGRARARIKDFEGAEEDISNAVKLNPKLKPMAEYNKAAISALMGKKGDMLFYLGRAKRSGAFDDKTFVTSFKKDEDFIGYRRDYEFLKFVNKLK